MSTHKILKIFMVIFLISTAGYIYAQEANNILIMPPAAPQARAMVYILKMRFLAAKYLAGTFPGQQYKYVGCANDKDGMSLLYRLSDGSTVRVRIDKDTNTVSGAELMSVFCTYYPHHRLRRIFIVRENYDAAGKFVDRTMEDRRYSTRGHLVSSALYSGEYRMLDYRRYYPDGTLYVHYAYEYAANGDRVKIRTYNTNEELTAYSELTYDSGHHMTKQLDYDAAGNLTGHTEYEYDADGNKTKKSSYDLASGLVIFYIEYEYDADGKLSRDSSYYAGGLVTYTEYGYDAAGNLLEERYCTPSGKLAQRITYEYDAANNRTKMSYYNKYDSLVYWWEYEYDSNGDRVRSYSYDSLGNLIGRLEAEYDGAHNKIRERGYDAAGNLTLYTEIGYSNILEAYTYYVPSGRVHTRTDINLTVYEYTDENLNHTGIGRLIKVTYRDGSYVEYENSPEGKGALGDWTEKNEMIQGAKGESKGVTFVGEMAANPAANDPRGPLA